MQLEDALMDDGHVRGEWLALHARRARGERNPAIEARLEQLTRRHLKDLLGPLHKVLEDVHFDEHGELVQARLRAARKEVPDLDDRRWHSLHTLDVARGASAWLFGPGGQFDRFINALRSLTTLHGLSRRAHWPATPCTRVEHLEVSGVDFDVLFDTFPAARTVTWNGFGVRPWSHPRLAQLERFSLGDQWAHSLSWSKGVLRVNQLPSLDALEWIAAGPPLERLELEERRFDWEGLAYDLRDVFAAARARGAQVVVVPAERRADEEDVPWRPRRAPHHHPHQWDDLQW